MEGSAAHIIHIRHEKRLLFFQTKLLFRIASIYMTPKTIITPRNPFPQQVNIGHRTQTLHSTNTWTTKRLDGGINSIVSTTRSRDQALRIAMAASTTVNMSRNAAIKAPMTAPLEFWQKSPNCWQIGSQFAFELPLWAKETTSAAAAPAPVDRPIAICNRQNETCTSLLLSMPIRRKRTQ